MVEYLQEFERQNDELTSLGIKLPTEVLACKILNSANLDVKERQMALSATSQLEFQNQWIISDVAKLHPSVELHLNMVVTVLKYQHNLRQLVQQTRSKSKNKPSAKQRAKQKRKS